MILIAFLAGLAIGQFYLAYKLGRLQRRLERLERPITYYPPLPPLGNVHDHDA